MSKLLQMALNKAAQMTPLPDCPNGHPMEGANIIWKSGNEAYCRICRDSREMERSESKRNKRARDFDREHEVNKGLGFKWAYTSNSCHYRKSGIA